jgi:hypothetical protein
MTETVAVCSPVGHRAGIKMVLMTGLSLTKGVSQRPRPLRWQPSFAFSFQGLEQSGRKASQYLFEDQVTTATGRMRSLSHCDHRALPRLRVAYRITVRDEDGKISHREAGVASLHQAV